MTATSTTLNYCRCDYSRWRLGTKKSGPSKAYEAWKGMKQRCNNPNLNYYYRYGGRGITYCDRWEEFDNFFQDMGHPPSPDLSLEREDNDGDYTPENCFWATKEEQANNRECTRFETAFGRTQSLSQWAREFNMLYKTLAERLQRGMSLEDALTIKLHKGQRDETFVEGQVYIAGTKRGRFQFDKVVNGIRYLKSSKSLSKVLDFIEENGLMP